METKKQDRKKWLLIGLISFLVLSVVFLNVMVLKIQNRLDWIDAGRIDKSAATSVDKTPTPTQAQIDKAAKSKVWSHKTDDSWANSPFDPDTWNPFAELERMQNKIEHVFADSFGRLGRSPKYSSLVPGVDFSPDVDVSEKGDTYVVRMDLPGVSDGSVDVHVDGREVTVSGERDDVTSQKDAKGNVIQEERKTGSFSRSIELPGPVNAHQMTATNEKGVFTIVLPKATGKKAG